MLDSPEPSKSSAGLLQKIAEIVEKRNLPVNPEVANTGDQINTNNPPSEAMPATDDLKKRIAGHPPITVKSASSDPDSTLSSEEARIAVRKLIKKFEPVSDKKE